MASWSVFCADAARICERVSEAVSLAKSESRMTDSAEVVFSSEIPRLRMVAPTVLAWKAPRRPRSELTSRMERSTTSCAAPRLPSTTFRSLPEVRSDRR